ncbi:MAG TPA: VOC family protein [Pseudonocardiaceae bacterium]|nr:VOC family protein [Pseudonocardiaceae bacterium]
MARYRIRQIVLDTNRLDVLIDFWSAALGYELHHRTADYASLRDPAGLDPVLFLQLVPEPKAMTKNRAHIDIEVPDEQAAVARLTGLGATVRWREPSDTWTALADPDGNEFCVGHF